MVGEGPGRRRFASTCLVMGEFEEKKSGEDRIILDFVPSHDGLLTCVVCGADGVDQETTVRDRWNSRVTIGKHRRCVWLRLRKDPKDPD